MKVALDATPLTVPTGGIPRYVLELHRALAAVFPDESFDLIEPGVGRWWSTGLPLLLRRENYSLFHGTDFAVPYVPVCASVMTIHDLSPWKNEPWRAASARVRRRTPWLLRLGLVTMVITPTEAIRREAIAHFHLDPARVVAVPEAAPVHFAPVARAAHAAKYALCVGTIEPRKNLTTAIEACRLAGIELWISGRGEMPPTPGVRFLGAVSDADLPALYSAASVFLYPSLYEGFGLPVLEAMQCGAPVITSLDAALVEVSGDAALHAPAGDPRAWAEAIRAVIANPQPWRELSLRRAAEFSWRRSAELTRAVYQEAVCRHAR
ncbi:MAG: glycosyltransferase family 1 protein [Bryobacteraceae bacterium]